LSRKIHLAQSLSNDFIDRQAFFSEPTAELPPEIEARHCVAPVGSHESAPSTRDLTKLDFRAAKSLMLPSIHDASLISRVHDHKFLLARPFRDGSHAKATAFQHHPITPCLVAETIFQCCFPIPRLTRLCRAASYQTPGSSGMPSVRNPTTT